MPDYKQRFRALLGGDRQPIKAYTPTVRSDGTVATLRLYDVIDSWGGPWGTSAKELADVLDELPDSVTEIHLHINSPGGEVTEGVAMLNVLRAHAAKVVAIVDGLAASAASYLAAGCDELVMMRNAELMIHDPWGLCVGNAADLRSLADLLDHMADNIASIYKAKAGGELTDWRAAMAVETWYSDDEALAAGLADRIDGGTAATATEADDAKNRFDLSVFNFSGRREAPGPQHPAPGPGGGPDKPEGGPAVAFSDEQFTHLRQALNLPDNADEAAIFAALDTALQDYVEPPAPTNNQPPALPDGVTLPEGVVALSTEQFAALSASAQAGVEARAQQVTDHRNGLVNAAIEDGRIAPAERQAWLDKLAAGTGAEAVLAALTPGLVPVTEIGTSVNDLATEDEALYAKVFGKDAEVSA